MKKVTTILAAFAFLAVLAFSSCKKEYTCECTLSDSSGTFPTTTTSGKTEKEKKKDAKKDCEDASSTTGTITVKCELK